MKGGILGLEQELQIHIPKEATQIKEGCRSDAGWWLVINWRWLTGENRGPVVSDLSFSNEV